MPAIYPVFERPLPRADSFNGNSLSRHLRQLDEIASAIKVSLVSRFIDNSTMAHELLDDELAAMSVPQVEWYDARDGLLTLHGILAAIQQSDARFHSRRGDDTQALLS